MPEWVTIVAQAILNEWTIGTYSRFCDEVDFDSATVEEIAELIWREYQAAQQCVKSDDGGQQPFAKPLPSNVFGLRFSLVAPNAHHRGLR